MLSEKAQKEMQEGYKAAALAATKIDVANAINEVLDNPAISAEKKDAMLSGIMVLVSLLK
jgi:hypothetical protein